ncbi:MAG: DUF6402 family protein [bacterium]
MSILNLKNQIAEIINQCKDTPVEAPYQRSCKLEYTLSFKVLKICGEPLEGANVTINPFAIKDEEEKEVTKEDGSVSFKELKRKHYVIEVEYDGFHKKVETVMLPQNKTFFIQFELDDIKDDEFKITLIPRIMRHNKWDKGAELMEHWFRKKAYTYPNPKNVNTGKEPCNKNIITLAWAKEFEEVKEAYDEIWDDKIYASDAVKNNIKKECINLDVFNKLTKVGQSEVIPEKLSKNPNILISNYSQYHKVLSSADKVEYLLWKEHDDLMAALANFTFMMNLQYKVEYKGVQKHFFGNKTKVYTISILKVALYIRDSYDFIGVNEFGLGWWNYKEKKLSATNHLENSDYHEVTNKSFRDWRDTYGCGGDFLVFSDVEERNTSESWEVEFDI